MADTWSQLIVDQLDFYVNGHLRPRLEGLTDDEYFWEPTANCWSVRQEADGAWSIETSWPEPEPDPPPITTIGWRLAHIAASNLGTRVSTFFGDRSIRHDADMFDERHRVAVPGTAAEAIDLLNDMCERWRAGVLSLSDERLAAPLGPKGAFYSNDPMAALVLHVSRETIHHGGEIGVLRDLYRAR